MTERNRAIRDKIDASTLSQMIPNLARQIMSEREQPGLRAKLMEEIKRTLVIFLYLASFLGAFTLYRRIVLSEYHISYLHYGYAIFKALVLSKVIVIGIALKIGERFNNYPLIIPTFYKTFCFSIFLFVFTLIEHLVSAWIRRQSANDALEELLSQGGLGEILARVLVLLLALLPMFAVTELGRVLGDGKLYELFFRKSDATSQSAEEASFTRTNLGQ